MLERVRAVGRRVVESYTLYVVVGLVVGLAVAPYAWAATSGPEGTIAVVPVEGTIDGDTAAAYSEALRQARADPDVSAVVLVANSGGGGASASEQMYLATKRTAAEMPVVVSVDAGALSGAYYTIAPADRIFVKPSSLVGSIGVLATMPSDVEPNDVIATTGPNKLSGADQRAFLALLESLKNAFVGAVVDQRGDALQLTPAEVSRARIYSGADAVQNGLADQIGGREMAVRHAARMAGLSDYDVVVYQQDETRFVSRNNFLASSAPNKTMVPASRLVGNGSSPVLLLVPRAYVSDAIAERAILDAGRVENGTVDSTAAVRQEVGARGA